MAPFGKVAPPMVGMRGCEVVEAMRGVMPDMGARGVSPVIGVNMVPGIMDMLGTGTKPKTQIHTYRCSKTNQKSAKIHQLLNPVAQKHMYHRLRWVY